MNNNIYFVTTNLSKFTSYEKSFKEMGVVLNRINAELFEPQSTDPKEIITSKLVQAKKKNPGKSLIVDDRSLFIPALNNYPGPSLKLVIKTLGAKGLLKLMKGEKKRDAIFTTAMGFYDKKHDHFFFHNELGFLLENKKGNNLRGWTEILYIYAHESMPKISLAQYSDSQWDAHQKEVDITKDLQEYILRIIKKKG